MTYLCWGAVYEGASDASYFEVLIPKVMQSIVLRQGIRQSIIPMAPAVICGINGRDVATVATEACAASTAFHLFFVHADVGGRGLEQGLANRSVAYCQAMAETCQWPSERCIVIAPRHETEAWILADPDAVTKALGYRGASAALGLPSGAAAAERLPDPKAVLRSAIDHVRGHRRTFIATQLYGVIAQHQSVDCLLQSQTFKEFHSKIETALRSLGAIA